MKDSKIYCRKCVMLDRASFANKISYFNNKNIKANLDYSLSKTQLEASEKVLSYIKNNENVIVNAVCGSGKTELVYKSIEHMINNNKVVAFAIPRKDVVIEIYNRLVKDYPSIDITCVYGGNTSKLEGQIVVLTTHQLFRYKKYFDLLILDEADAFPYYGDEMLHTFLKESVKGPIIYLSATIKENFKKECKNVVYVNRRYHNYDLPVPKVIYYNFINKISVIKKLIETNKNKPILIYVATIQEGKYLAKKLNVPFVYSSYIHKQKYIDLFKENKIDVLITTSILERGITLKNVQVIVYNSSHQLFDEATLIQISGRVGRKKDYPTGNVYFLTTKKSDSISKCIKTIKAKNKAIA